MKNKNEYRENGKLYVKRVKSCKCRLKSDDRYIVTCSIHQRGTHEYSFFEGDGWITKIGGERRLWLSEEARTTVCGGAAFFDERLQSLTGKGREIRMEDAGLSVFLSGLSGKLACAIRYENGDSQRVTQLLTEASLGEVLHRLQFLRGMRDSESKELLQNPTKENIMQHPFILAAEKDGDVKAVKSIKMFYGLADNKDCALLAKITGERILPALPEEYDREYYIDADTLTGKSLALLNRSGYTVLHRPGFAMKGSTHSIITLNPHTKHGVDAARTDANSISFGDFLGLFDSCEPQSAQR